MENVYIKICLVNDKILLMLDKYLNFCLLKNLMKTFGYIPIIMI